ncbi:MAG: aldo/keto reductase [Deltaproteobacteria bacterium]|nr:aldo/keto reductase [Deltaproteobacteria bacterium]
MKTDPAERIEICSDIRVSRLGHGGAALGGWPRDIGEHEAREIIQRCLSVGINYFDTAPLYGSGRSEMRLGTALSEVPRSNFIISTKVGYSLVPLSEGSKNSFFENSLPYSVKQDFSRTAVEISIKESLDRLKTDYLDMVFLHDPDAHIPEALNEALPALRSLKDSGVVRAIGVGVKSHETLLTLVQRAEFDVVMLSGRYTLLEQEPLNELFPLLQKREIPLILGGTYNSGILAGTSSYEYASAPPLVAQKVESITKVASKYGVDLRAVANQFCLAHPCVYSIIPSVLNSAQIDENIEMLRCPIPAELWTELKELELLHKDAPVPA